MRSERVWLEGGRTFWGYLEEGRLDFAFFWVYDPSGKKIHKMEGQI